MQSWLSFWNSLFWVTLFIFYFNQYNFLDLLLFSEIVWITLFIISIFFGSLSDDINLYSLSFFIIALAALEFCIGLLLLVLFKNYNIDFNFKKNDNLFSSYFNKNSKSTYLNKFFF